jgi:endonuclease YncB( thermonuclease family)
VVNALVGTSAQEVSVIPTIQTFRPAAALSLLLSICLSVAAATAYGQVGPKAGVWHVKGKDSTTTWSAVLVLRQPSEGIYNGFFIWKSVAGDAGHEIVRGSFDSQSNSITLRGVEVLDGKGEISTATYNAAVTSNGSRIEKGRWNGDDVIPGEWNAVWKVTYLNPAIRSWSSNDGKYKTQAEFVRVENEVATLRNSDGNMIGVPFSQLSAADRNFVMRAAKLPKAINAWVVEVTDVATIKVLDVDHRLRTIRLNGIDASKGGQASNEQSLDALGSKVFGKSVHIRWVKQDTDRISGNVYLANEWFNLTIIENGWARRNKGQSEDDLLRDAEESAKSRGRGVWSPSEKSTRDKP